MNLEDKKYRRRSGWLPYVEIAVRHLLPGHDRVRHRDLQLLRHSVPVLFVFGYYWAGFGTLYQEHQGRLRWLKQQKLELARQLAQPRRRRSCSASRVSASVRLIRPSRMWTMLMAVGGGFGVVGDHQDGLAEALVQVAQNLQHGFRILGVQVAGGLVGQQDGRVVHDGAGDGDALLLAAGERVGLVVQAVRDAEQAQHFLELRVRLRRRCRRCSAPPRYCRAR